MNDLIRASKTLESFRDGSLKDTLSRIEQRALGLDGMHAASAIAGFGADSQLLAASLLIKRQSNQISEVIHAVGILLSLPVILEPSERIEGLSLGAGNTGRGADLETDKRIAEFTFIEWQGGPESIRQNKVFKDFFFLAEANTNKRRELYVVGVTHPEKFFQSRRSVSTILKNNDKLGKAFRSRYGDTAMTVREYYNPRRHLVALRDLTSLLPTLATE